jgi:Coenzyme PQQ synthesis protein D (PqqD)
MVERRPLARTEGVIVSELDDELVLYDSASGVACRLNSSAALVWHNCDGTRTIADLAELLSSELGELADEDVVLVALDTLAEHDLIASGYERRDAIEMRLSRRRFIRRVGVVGGVVIALPVVSSLVVPAAAAAASVSYNPNYGNYSVDYYNRDTHTYF